MRRDEAEAEAREEEQDRRTQIVDSERRLQLLRGQPADDLSANDESPSTVSQKNYHVHDRKRRRLQGEDDTDRDMRLAREDAARQPNALRTLRRTDEPLMDTSGHINLFPAKPQGKEKNMEAEIELAKKKREYENQYTMRFSNAAGFKQGLNAPWYSAISKDNAEEVPGKDVWGNEDISRRGREKIRADANDPLAAMKRGVKKLREVERSRQDWKAERDKELQELKALEKSRQSERRDRKRRREKSDSDGLEGFSLDSSTRYHERDQWHHTPRSHRRHRV